MKKYLFTLLNFLLVPMLCVGTEGPVSAEINIVATLPWIGSIAKEIGKDKVNINVLVKPNHDPHYIEAKPSMILAARKADIIMYNGLDLEIGYLPLIIESSRNPRIQPGKIGNLDCSRYIEPIERPLSVDKSMGDVHPLGNPHYHLSPGNILKAAEGMADAFSKIDSINAELYRKSLSSFKGRLKERQGQWNVKQLKGKRFIAYHRYFEYLAAEFGFSIIGYIEPKPGIPPSLSHVEGLIETVREKKPDAILFTVYGGKREVDFISQKTGVKGIMVPHDAGSHEGINDWFDLMDRILESIE